MRAAQSVALAALFVGGIAQTGSADTVHLTNGYRLHGEVSVVGDSVIVKTRAGRIWLRKFQVDRIERRETSAQKFRRKRAKLIAERPDDLGARVKLADQTRRDGLVREADAELRAVLARDPDHTGARGALGQVRHEGVWITRAERKRLLGLMEVDGEWITAAEARVRLERERAEHEAEAATAAKQLAEARILVALAEAKRAEAEAERAEAEAEQARKALRLRRYPRVVVLGNRPHRPFFGFFTRHAATPPRAPHTRQLLSVKNRIDPYARLLRSRNDPCDPYNRLRPSFGKATVVDAVAAAHAAAIARAAGLPEPGSTPVFRVGGSTWPHCRR